MCRSLKVLCAALGRDRLSELKRAAVSVEWELVAGAVSLDELEVQLSTWTPDIVVIDAGLGSDALAWVRDRLPQAHATVVGTEGPPGAPVTRDLVRAAILGLPRPGGPVRG